MGNILITGGAGFIGSHFVKKVKHEGVVVLDKLTYAGSLNRLADVRNDIEFIEGDICDEKLLHSIFKSYDIQRVINFAAESHVDNSIDDATEFMKTNVIGVQKLMDVFRNYLAKDSLFVQISTDEVYGPSHAPCLTTAPLLPKNPYAASKASAELLVKAYENTYGFPSIITRTSNNYGMHQYPEKLIPKVVEYILSQKDIPLYGHGQHKRCWIHVKDHVERLWTIIQEHDVHKIYNISGQDVLTNNQLVQMLISLFSSNGYDYKGHIQYIDDRLGHDISYAIEDEQSYLNKVSLNKGLQEIVESSLQNRAR